MYKLRRADRPSRNYELEDVPMWIMYLFGVATLWVVTLLPGGLGL